MSETNAPQPDVTLLLDMDGVIREATLSASLSNENVDGWLGKSWSEIVGLCARFVYTRGAMINAQLISRWQRHKGPELRCCM